MSKVSITLNGNDSYFAYLRRDRCQIKFAPTPNGRQRHAGTFNLTTRKWHFDERVTPMPPAVQTFFEEVFHFQPE